MEIRCDCFTGYVLYSLRCRSRLGQQAIAEFVYEHNGPPLSVQKLQAIEDGSEPPTQEMVCYLAAACGNNVSDIFETAAQMRASAPQN